MLSKGDHGVGMFIGSFLLGASVGAACGLLFAPTSGSEARSYLADALTFRARRRRRVRERRAERLAATGRAYATYGGPPAYLRKSRPGEGDN